MARLRNQAIQQPGILVSAEDSWKAHAISGMLVESIVDQRTSRPQHRICTVGANEHAFDSALAAIKRDPRPFQRLASRRATAQLMVTGLELQCCLTLLVACRQNWLPAPTLRNNDWVDGVALGWGVCLCLCRSPKTSFEMPLLLREC